MKTQEKNSIKESSQVRQFICLICLSLLITCATPLAAICADHSGNSIEIIEKGGSGSALDLRDFQAEIEESGLGLSCTAFGISGDYSITFEKEILSGFYTLLGEQAISTENGTFKFIDDDISSQERKYKFSLLNAVGELESYIVVSLRLAMDIPNKFFFSNPIFLSDQRPEMMALIQTGGQVGLLVMDELGKVLANRDLLLDKGLQTISLPEFRYASGQYIVLITETNATYSLRFRIVN